MAPRLLSCLCCAGRNGRGAEQQEGGGGVAVSPVLVEIFTSQGCGTSAEAEAVASRLGRGEVAVLVWHVDYWDYRGWKDPFGSSAWTVRQKAYVEALRLDTMYTPQAVVQGRAQCLANDHHALAAAVRDAPRFPAPTFQATFSKPSADTLQISFKGMLLHNKVEGQGGSGDVVVVLYESGLVTECGEGENKGRVLTNDYVVRRLEKLCALKDVSAKKKKNVSGQVRFSLWDGFSRANCGVILFVQGSSFKSFGVQQFNIPDTII